jgi:hypothetical protein
LKIHYIHIITQPHQNSEVAMKVRTMLFLVGLLSLCVLFTQAGKAQQRVSIQLRGTDGGGINDTLNLVVDTAGHNDATPDSLSPALKESSQGLPPPPQGIDLRVAANSGWDGAANYTSIHDLLFDTQTDVWKIQFQRDQSQSNMTLSWDAGFSF